MVSEAPVENNVDLKGRWTIECIVFNDSLTVTPSSEVPGVAQYAVFEDGSFSFNTNCNSIQGEYQLKGDSILIPVSLSTEMACDNMATEDAIRKILPGISTVSMENDSTVRLVASSPVGYILLRSSRRQQIVHIKNFLISDYECLAQYNMGGVRRVDDCH